MANSSIWLRPYDPTVYDFPLALEKQGFVHWQQYDYHFSVGDIIFLYASSPVQRVVARLEVVATNIQYRIGMDDDDKFYIDINPFEKEPICIKVIPLDINKRRHPTYQDLLGIGVKSVQSANHLTGEQASKIMDMFYPERVELCKLVVGDRVVHKKYGEGTVFAATGGYVFVEFADKQVKFENVTSVKNGHLEKVK